MGGYSLLVKKSCTKPKWYVKKLQNRAKIGLKAGSTFLKKDKHEKLNFVISMT